VNKLRSCLVVASVSVLMIAAGCGSSDGSQFGNGNGNGNGDGQGGENGGFSDSAGITPGSLGELQTCATSAAAGALTPTNLIFMFDRSGSMFHEDKTDVKAQKWDPVVAATKAFFSDNQSAGLKASLTYFPKGDEFGRDDDKDKDNNREECRSSTYEKSNVPLQDLPSGAFGTSLDNTGEQSDTPTRPALQGAVVQAKAAAASGTRTVIVFVTDGQPHSCGDTNSVTGTENVASGAFNNDKIPTYVIGVGNSGNLDTIAAAGGTTKATMVVLGATPQATNDAFRTALGVIRSQVGSCTFTLPSPPAGKVLDTKLVNVVFTPGGGGPQTLQYSSSCTGEGWRYDNIAAPKQVELCNKTCDVIRADKAGKIAIAFGCATKGDIK